MDDVELRKFAAESCRREIERLNAVLQELEGGSPRRKVGRPSSSGPTGKPAASKGKRRGMSAAARKRQSERMKAFWAKRKAAKAK